MRKREKQGLLFFFF